MLPRQTQEILTIAGLLAAASCGPVQSAAKEEPVAVRMSTGFATGNFRPFSEALVKGYRELMPDLRVQPVDTSGSIENIQALHDGTVDVGLAQAGIAYMAYNGRFRGSAQQLRNIRGIAVLNSSAVQLLVGPGSRIRSMDELRGRRVGVGPNGSGAAVISEMVLDGYFSRGEVQKIDASVPRTNEMLLENSIDAAFTISSVPNDDASHLTQAGARLLPIRGSAMVKLRTLHPFFRSEVIPAGAYAGMDEAVHTLAVDVVLLTRASLEDATVRRLTEGLFRMLPRLNAELPFVKGMDPERAPATPVPLHPGAALYYRERELRR
jgi:TRAP transporter TAXI family solute receptor